MLRYFKYRIPFKRTFSSAGNQFTHREGIIVCYTDEQGIEAYGEVAPLPGFSTESLNEVEQVLSVNKEHLEESIKSGNAKETLKLLHQIHRFPSLSFGLGTLIYDLEAKRENTSLLKYLFPDWDGTLKANGVVGLKSKSGTLADVEHLSNNGFETIKIKIGQNIEEEIDHLKAIRKGYPNIKIRVDANQSWDETEAIRNLKELENLSIEYCEQPIPAGNPESLKRVSDSTNIPVAADESIRNIQDAKELSEAESADIFIIKPMLYGAFDDFFVTKEIVDTHLIDTVFTTSLETAIGRAAIAALAAGLGSPKYAQGLATGSLLKNDIVKEDWLDHAIINFPNQPGIGVVPDLQKLTEV
ncbi:o-succinylbenzoate synthase [Gracilimonas sp.]|uniref:o-succinylbenzoate synthase n=1 Tax=Gracilimonas sp. TaxID=1974203 RepID=UPI002870DC6A|nr:o-succinylbenzoate synthase [Gracilimonas sp.]